MTIRPQDQYPGQIDTSDPAMPYGKFKNVAVQGDGSGSPLEKEWPNDILGAFFALLDSAGITPNNVADKVGASQFLDALNTRIGTVENLAVEAYEAMYGTPHPGIFTPPGGVTNPGSASFSADGLKSYVMDSGTGILFEYDLSTAWDNRTAVYNSVGATPVTIADARSVTWKPDGLAYYVLGSSEIGHYTCDVAWSLANVNYIGKKAIGGGATIGDCIDLCWNPDGTGFYLYGIYTPNAHQVVRRWTTSPAWTVVSASDAANQVVDAITEVGVSASTGGVEISGDGRRMFVSDATDMYEYSLATPFSGFGGYTGRARPLSTLVDSTPDFRALTFSNNGKHLLVANDSGEVVSVRSSVVRMGG